MSDMPNFSTDLSGQTAFITGTTSGLGYRFAQVLAACGANVAIAGRRVERLETLAEELRSTGATETGPILWPFCAHLVPILELSSAFGSTSWGHLGPSWGHLGAILGPS